MGKGQKIEEKENPKGQVWSNLSIIGVCRDVFVKGGSSGKKKLRLPLLKTQTMDHFSLPFLFLKYMQYIGPFVHDVCKYVCLFFSSIG